MKDATKIKVKALEDAKGRLERKLTAVARIPGQRGGPFAEGLRDAIRLVAVEIEHVKTTD